MNFGTPPEIFRGREKLINSLFHDGGCYHIETSPLICSALFPIKELILEAKFEV